MDTVNALIEFLLDLLRDEQAQAEFARDPQGMLARAGLEGVSAQDVCDAQPIVADHPAVRHHPQHDAPRHHHDGPRHHDHDDPVREIHHVVKTHTVEKDVVVKHHSEQNVYNEYNSHFSYTDNSITADTVIQDSFNQDNDGVDNKGGIINDSNVANGDQEDVGNTDEDTTITDSLNEDNSETEVVVDSGNDFSDNSTSVADSGNDSSTSTDVDVNGSYNEDSSTTVGGDVDNDGADVDLVNA
ncbi:IniB N-terminal domain-containing protein [Pseudonocardia lacus]|jgi:hypothetical protein|uniref:IniB N-terminal domain-containing protein n=1 Tax=Pseudonocardia lacus TaxID=2835865 RepID=UPI001BDDC894|nr:IniB N-terminal domain-containing protein [Pseudonocardia lacus]